MVERDWQKDMETCKEATKPIPGFEGYYEADEEGNIWSIGYNWRGYGRRIIKPSLDKYGYLKVRLTINGRRKKYLVHRLVCMAFHGEPPSSDMEVRHLNGIKTDNRPSNLAWGTHQENELDAVRLKEKARGDKNGARKYRDRVSAGIKRWLASNPEKIRRGEKCWQAKFTDEQVLEIRKAYLNGEKPSDIARRYGANYNTIYSICRGYNYGHLRVG